MEIYHTQTCTTYRTCGSVGDALWLWMLEDSTVNRLASLLFAILSAVRIWVLMQCFCSHTEALIQTHEPLVRLCVHTRPHVEKDISGCTHTSHSRRATTITTKPQELAATQTLSGKRNTRNILLFIADFSRCRMQLYTAHWQRRGLIFRDANAFGRKFEINKLHRRSHPAQKGELFGRIQQHTTGQRMFVENAERCHFIHFAIAKMKKRTTFNARNFRVSRFSARCSHPFDVICREWKMSHLRAQSLYTNQPPTHLSCGKRTQSRKAKYLTCEPIIRYDTELNYGNRSGTKLVWKQT